ncbi:MAG: TrbC/VirB2 family protein [bacterium]
MKNLFNKTKIKFLCSAIMLLDAGSTFAQSKLENPISANSIPAFLKSILTAATEIGAIVGALSIMYGGFLYATAQGDEEKLKKAKTTVTWAVIGTAVLIGAQVIITAVTSTVGGVIN